jgi:ABC-type glycerol-3-phosphate transport system substrate-binding protein
MKKFRKFPISLKQLLIITSLFLVMIAGGCEFQVDFRELADQIIEQVVPAPEDTAVPVDSSPTVEATEVVEVNTTPTPLSGAVELVLWVPPQFDPEVDSPANQLFKQRIAEFEETHEDIFVTVRVKSVSGATSLLESLTITSTAASQGMPSLIALPRSDLETAVSRNLLIPFEAYSSAIDEQDWYNYAQNLTVVGANSYGLPFAGDVLAMIYRSEAIGEFPETWDEILRRGEPIAFPAADPQSLTTMALYLSSGGEIDTTQRLPQMDLELLNNLYQLYADGAQSGVFPLWLTDLQRDTDAWTAYNELRSNQVITWASRYLSDPSEDSTLALLPAFDNEELVTIADGWVWCLTDPRVQTHEISVELAEFLTDAAYLSDWSSEAGVFPVRPSTLNTWEDTEVKSLLGELALIAHRRPTNEIIGIIGLVMEDQLVQILSGKTTAPFAAQAVIDHIGNP